MSELPPTAPIFSGFGVLLNRLALILAYCGGAVVAALGIMSAISIIGRSAIGRPITGDFELVEIGTAVAGSLFLSYCQATSGHVAVDFFTLKASVRTKERLDRFGCLLMGIMFLVVGWRTAVGGLDKIPSHETSMLLGFPIWLGYALTVPGVVVAGITAIAQSLGVKVAEPAAHE